MAIGKTMVVMVCFMIAAMAMVTIFSIAQNDKSTDSVYTNITSTINGTTHTAQGVANAGIGFMQALIFLTAIMFFGAVIMIFRKK